MVRASTAARLRPSPLQITFTPAPAAMRASKAMPTTTITCPPNYPESGGSLLDFLASPTSASEENIRQTVLPQDSRRMDSLAAGQLRQGVFMARPGEKLPASGTLPEY